MTKKLLLMAVLCLAGMAYAGTTVPFEARLDTEIHFVAPCGMGCIQATMDGSGQALHGGRVTVEGPVQLNLFTGAQTATPTMTTADGSTLTLSVDAVAAPNGPQSFTLSGTWTAISGTGRFEGVSGEGTLDGLGSGSTGSVHFEGTLNNPGHR